MVEIRDICREASDERLQVNVFNNYFLYTDQYLSIFSQTLQCILTTGLIVIAVSLVLLPDLMAAVATVFCIISTLVGTLGLMSIWDIALDGITLINLIMCIGFSVDYSAHFAYHYIDLKKKEETSDVVDKSLASVSKPILQGGVSTILGLLGLIFAPSTGFVIFFKVIFIVITLGIVHSLIILPCLLQMMVDVRMVLQSSRKEKELGKEGVKKAPSCTLVSVTKLEYDNYGFVEHFI